MEATILTCSFCHQPIQPTFFFCPNCGKEAKPKPLNISALTQLGIYALSLLLPPLGLWPGMKYLREPNQSSKLVGIIAILLTIISLIVTFYLAAQLANTVNQQVMKQVQQIQGF